jgi:hypothetical protein
VDPKLESARRELTTRVMGKPGVTGTAVGERKGRPCLLVYLSDAKAKSSVPRSVDGFEVVVEVTGPFKRL